MKTMMIGSVLALALCAPASAQTTPASGSTDPDGALSIRPFVLATSQSFAAKTTFDAVFGGSVQPFWGGGVEVVIHRHLFVDIAASRFRKNGQRAVRFNNQTFRLGLPLTVTITPLEVTGGYRFTQVSRRVVPYAGAGVSSYGYIETSPTSDASENVATRHAGYLVMGGAEVRVHRWVRASADVQYTHVTGIIGSAGISQQAGERDLGGRAFRARVLVGR